MGRIQECPCEILGQILAYTTVDCHPAPKSPLLSTSLVHSSWAKLSQQLLWLEIVNPPMNSTRLMLDSPLLGKYRTRIACFNRIRVGNEKEYEDFVYRLVSRLWGVKELTLCFEGPISMDILQLPGLADVTSASLITLQQFIPPRARKGYPTRIKELHVVGHLVNPKMFLAISDLISSNRGSLKQLDLDPKYDGHFDVTYHSTMMDSFLLVAPFLTSLVLYFDMNVLRVLPECTSLQNLELYFHTRVDEIVPLLPDSIHYMVLCIHPLEEKTRVPLLLEGLSRRIEAGAFPHLMRFEIDEAQVSTIEVATSHGDSEVRLKEVCRKAGIELSFQSQSWTMLSS